MTATDDGFSALKRFIEQTLKIQCNNYKEDYIKRRLLSRMRSTATTTYPDYLPVPPRAPAGARKPQECAHHQRDRILPGRRCVRPHQKRDPAGPVPWQESGPDLVRRLFHGRRALFDRHDPPRHDGPGQIALRPDHGYRYRRGRLKKGKGRDLFGESDGKTLCRTGPAALHETSRR